MYSPIIFYKIKNIFYLNIEYKFSKIFLKKY